MWSHPFPTSPDVAQRHHHCSPGRPKPLRAVGQTCCWCLTGVGDLSQIWLISSCYTLQRINCSFFKRSRESQENQLSVGEPGHDGWAPWYFFSIPNPALELRANPLTPGLGGRVPGAGFHSPALQALTDGHSARPAFDIYLILTKISDSSAWHDPAWQRHTSPLLSDTCLSCCCHPSHLTCRTGINAIYAPE